VARPTRPLAGGLNKASESVYSCTAPLQSA